MPVKPRENTPALNIRIKSTHRRLIERAAKELEQSVSEFVRDAAVREAQHTLADQTTFHIDDKTWEKFIVALDAPTKDNPRLRDLMSREPAWKE